MTPPNRPFRHPALALILGWLLPGSGHLLLGQRIRGLRVMAGIGGLLVLGVLIGGVDAVDSLRDRLWYLAQLPAGPLVIVLDVLSQKVVRTMDAPAGYHAIGLGHINAIGTLYIALAGLMNVVVMLDLFRDRSQEHKHRRQADQHPDAARGEA
jgi:TM2 domain-containing membrane protein YozV